jgi:hypothetical protein
MVTQVGYSVVRRSRGRVAPCAVCIWHVETRSARFLIEPQNQGRRFVNGLASKSFGRFLPVWPQNRWWVSWLSSKSRWWRVFRLGPQTRQLWFGDLGLKITATISWFEPKNQVDFGLSVAPQNRRREVGAGHASRSNGLLRASVRFDHPRIDFSVHS